MVVIFFFKMTAEKYYYLDELIDLPAGHWIHHSIPFPNILILPFQLNCSYTESTISFIRQGTKPVYKQALK